MSTSTSKKWIKGCGIGCFLMSLLMVMALIGGSKVMMKPFEKATDARKTLDEQFGQQEDFIPAVDGSVSPERLETFLAVRSVLMPLCSEFADSDRQFEHLDELDDEASSKEILSEFTELTKTVFSMGSQMGGFFDARNQALLSAGMGRGEYTYIFTLAYLDQLRPKKEKEDSQPWGSNHPNERVRRALLQMLLHQQADLGEATSGDASSSLGEEIRRLEEQSRRLPWQDGLPAQIEASFAPYRDRLDELYCDHTVAFEFTQNRRRFLGIQGD